MARILVTNDDGVDAPGIAALAEAMRPLGEVFVVAPDRERSAASHAITLHEPLRVEERGDQRYCVSGTPTDAVYWAIHRLLPAKPDLVVSGINRGANLGSDVLYSGTVAAALEGALFGRPSLAFSLATRPEANLGHCPDDYQVAQQVASDLARGVLEAGLPPGVALSVNIPPVNADQIAGTKLCRLGFSDWTDVIEDRTDPRGKRYFWIGGSRAIEDPINGSDNRGIDAGHVTVTPLHYDIADYRSFAHTRGLKLESFPWVSDSLGDTVPEHPIIAKTTPVWDKSGR